MSRLLSVSNPAHRIASDAFAARIVAALAGFGAGLMAERTRDVELVAGEVSPDALDLVLQRFVLRCLVLHQDNRRAAVRT